MPTTKLKPAVNIITRDGLPALNVKVYSLPLWPDAEHVAAQNDISPTDAQAALNSAWDAAVEEFWQDVETAAAEHFGSGDNISAYAEGRSGGWVVVEGLGDVAAWTVKQRRTWARFAKDIEGAITYRSGADWIAEYLTEWVANSREQIAQERIRQAGPQLLAALKYAHGALVKAAEMFPTEEALQSPMVYSEGSHGKRIDVFAEVEKAIAAAEGSAA